MKLICPCCGETLIRNNNSYMCSHHHTFDIAKEGYINLIGKSHSGDNNDSVNGRRLFLESGYFKPLKDELINIFKLYDIRELLDIGCGEGYYDRDNGVSDIIGIDVSKEAIKKAAKISQQTYAVQPHTGHTYAVASAAALPIDETKAILSIFAPLFMDEVRRVLNNHGLIIKVTPKAQHLMELKEVLYSQTRESLEKEIHEDDFEKIYNKDLTYKIKVEPVHLKALLSMTPYAFTTSGSDIAKLEEINSALEITCSFNISIYEYRI